MAATLIQSNFNYQSVQGSQVYHFTIVNDSSGNVSVNEIKTPMGLTICQSSSTNLPEEVLEDIQTAMGQVRDLVAQTSAVNGWLTYTDETTQSFTFSTNMSNTNYRVQVSLPDFVFYRVVNKTVSGFDIELSTSFTGQIGFDVLI